MASYQFQQSSSSSLTVEGIFLQSSLDSHLHSSVQDKWIWRHVHLALLHLLLSQEHLSNSTSDSGANWILGSIGFSFPDAFSQPEVVGSRNEGYKVLSLGLALKCTYKLAYLMCSFHAPGVGGNDSILCEWRGFNSICIMMFLIAKINVNNYLT